MCVSLCVSVCTCVPLGMSVCLGCVCVKGGHGGEEEAGEEGEDRATMVRVRVKRAE